MDGIILDDVKKVIGFVSDYTENGLSVCNNAYVVGDCNSGSDNMKWPPTAKQISDAGLTPSEHALARRF